MVGNFILRRARKPRTKRQYLLVLAAVLVFDLLIIAIAVRYVASTGPSAIITGTAVKSGGNINFTPSSTMTPASIEQADWEYAVYRGTTVVKDFTPGTATLKRGMLVVMVATGNQVGDLLKIRYKGATVFDVATVS